MASSAADPQASVLILYCVINHSENDLQEHTEILLSRSPLIHLPQSSIMVPKAAATWEPRWLWSERRRRRETRGWWAGRGMKKMIRVQCECVGLFTCLQR